MAIVNRDLDASQQPEVLTVSLGAIATGVTTVLSLAPNPQKVVAAGMKAFGLSGAPVYSLNILRATVNGPTLIGLGATVTPAGGLSAAVSGISITLGASTWMQTGDMLVLNSGVANTAVTGAVVSVALQPLQDVQTYFGVAPV